MEFIRIDPMNLIDNQPYNSIIFTLSVGQKNKIGIVNCVKSTDYLQESLRMTEALKKVGHHYFQETHFGPNQHRLLNLQNQFDSGCNKLIELLKSTKTLLRYNYCLCNKYKSC